MSISLSAKKPTLLVCMGVSGCGKSTVAKALAEHYDFKYYDADDFHSERNKAHMAAGKPLTDAMRLPWVHTMREYFQLQAQRGNSCTLAFSGLRAAHRKVLRDTDMQTVYVFLQGSKDVIAKRMSARTEHFMPLSLLDSQFASLEDPRKEEDVLTIDIDQTLSGIIKDISGKIIFSH